MVVVRVVIQCSFPTATKEDETASGCEKNTEQGRGGGGGEGVGRKMLSFPKLAVMVPVRVLNKTVLGDS